jgi:hypothetical protein
VSIAILIAFLCGFGLGIVVQFALSMRVMLLWKKTADLADKAADEWKKAHDLARELARMQERLAKGWKAEVYRLTGSEHAAPDNDDARNLH